jgi:hypothetical protein
MICAFLAIPSISFAGEKVDFTGEWTLNEDKSELGEGRQGETFEMNSTEVWTLAEDGKILKIQSDISSPRGDRSATLVYNKK